MHMRDTWAGKSFENTHAHTGIYTFRIIMAYVSGIRPPWVASWCCTQFNISSSKAATFEDNDFCFLFRSSDCVASAFFYIIFVFFLIILATRLLEGKEFN